MGQSWPGWPGTEMLSILMLIMSLVISDSSCLPCLPCLRASTPGRIMSRARRGGLTLPQLQNIYKLRFMISCTVQAVESVETCPAFHCVQMMAVRGSTADQGPAWQSQCFIMLFPVFQAKWLHFTMRLEASHFQMVSIYNTLLLSNTNTNQRQLLYLLVLNKRMSRFYYNYLIILFFNFSTSIKFMIMHYYYIIRALYYNYISPM